MLMQKETFKSILVIIMTVILFFALKEGPLGSWVNAKTWWAFATGATLLIIFKAPIANKLYGA